MTSDDVASVTGVRGLWIDKLGFLQFDTYVRLYLYADLFETPYSMLIRSYQKQMWDARTFKFWFMIHGTLIV